MVLTLTQGNSQQPALIVPDLPLMAGNWEKLKGYKHTWQNFLEKLVHFQDSFPKERTDNRKLDTGSSQIPSDPGNGKEIQVQPAHEVQIVQKCHWKGPPKATGDKCRREANPSPRWRRSLTRFPHRYTSKLMRAIEQKHKKVQSTAIRTSMLCKVDF